MSRLTADDRVRRLLSIVPWIAARPDGVGVDELCGRFGIDRKTLLNDLTTLSFVGVWPYSPDAQVEVVIEDDRVFVHLPQWFDRPLRLTPDQALALVASGASLASVPGADPDGPLARGLAKLAATLGIDTDSAIDVDLGAADPATMDRLQRAIDDRQQVELEYYTYGRDERTTRVVDPYRLYADQGNWYLTGYCHLAEDERVFRVDRIQQVTVLATGAAVPEEPPSLGAFLPAADDPRVVLDLAPAARWVIEQYPVEVVEPRPDGTTRVTLAITAPAWFERLLVRLGPDATVVSAPDDLADAGPRAARRIRDRYRDR